MYILAGIFTLCCGVTATIMVLRRRYGLAAVTGYLCAAGVTMLVFGPDLQGYRIPAQEDTHADSRPQVGPFDDFVSSDTCQSCHPGPHDSWHASYHRTMTQLGTPEAVVGSFEGQVLKTKNFEFQLERRDEEFWVRIMAPGEGDYGPRRFRHRRVVMTTGSHHYQVFWLDGHYAMKEASDDRSVWMLPFAYVPDGEGWIPRSAAFVRPPEFDHVVDETARWNGSCIKCHSTHGVARRDESGFAMSRAAELGIACESCHGPGHEHIAANRNPLRRYRLYQDEISSDVTIVNPAKLNKYLGSQVCGRCHSIHDVMRETTVEEWEENGYVYRPGDDLHASFSRSRLKDMKVSISVKGDREAFLRDHFWSDGVLRVVGREYNGLLETPCFQKGDMSCMSCHRLHKADDDARSLRDWADDQLDHRALSNAACTQCHESYRDEAALTVHTNHTAGASGSLCYNCHMPHTAYGLLKASRNHTVTSPNVATTVETGRPNACNLCHLDKTLGWTAATLNEWYGQPEPDLDADEREIAASILWALQGDAGERGIMAWSFGWDEAREVSGDDWMPLYLGYLFGDPYAAVEIVAARSLKKYEGYAEFTDYPFEEDASARSLERWQMLSKREGGSERKHLLLDGNGEYDKARLERLLSGRDNEPIQLAE